MRLAGIASILALGLGINDALAQLSGTITVGTGGTYTSLTNAGGAFAAINASGTSGAVTFDIISNITEAGTNSLTGGTHAITITSSTTTQKVLTFNATSGTAPNNNANGGIRIMRPNVTIDGVETGIAAADAATKRLSFVRTVNNPVIGVFTDAADNVVIKNVDLVPNNNQAVFNLGALCTTDGIDNFEMTGCTVHPSGSNRSGNMVNLTAASPTTVRHDNGKINGNSFWNWGQSGAGSATVVGLNTALGWEVKNNHFFQTNTVSPTGNRTWTVIQLGSACGNATVTGNFIGGSDLNCGGATKLTTTAGGSDGWVRLMVFRLEQAGTEPASTVSNNRVTNIDMQVRWSGNCTEGGLDWWMTNGNLNVQDNEFGTGGEIILTRVNSTATNSPTRIRNQTMVAFTNSGTINFKRNKFENFTYRIGHTAGNFGQLDWEAIVVGDGGTGSTGDIFVEKNIIRNIKFEHTGTSTNSVMFFKGIKVNLGAATGTTSNISVDSNLIYNVTLNPLSTTATIVGSGGCSGGATFNATAEGIVVGSNVGGTTGSLQIKKNRIYDFKSNIGATITGIRCLGMASATTQVQIYNNVVSFNGGDGLGGNNNAIYRCLSVEPATASSESYYVNNNSFSISGTSNGSNNTACVNLNANALSVNLRNNAIQNTRTGSTGTHYAYFTLSSGLNTNNNIVNSATKLGHASGTDYDGLTEWSGAFYDNSGSQQVLLNFVDPANGNLSITNCTPITGVGTTVLAPYFVVTKDINNANHSSPVSPGAYVISAGSGAFSWIGTVSSAWNNAANWCGGTGGVPGASDDVNISGSPTPPFWPVLSSSTSVNNLTITGGSTQFTVNSGVTLTVNGDFSFSGTPANLTVTGSTFSFPSTSTQTISNLKAHNLTLSGNTTKNLTGTTTIANTLNISGASTLALVTAGSSLSVNGFFTGTGRLNGTATSNLTIGGTTTTTLALSSTSQFQDITLNSTGNSTISINGNLTLRNLTVINGTVNLNNSSVTITGDLIKSGVGVVSAGTGTVTMSGSGSQALTGPWNFNNLTVDKITDSDINIGSGSNISVAGVLTLKQGNTGFGVETNFNVGNSTLAIGAPIVDGGAGTELLNLTSGSSLTLNGTAVWPFPSIGGTAPSTLNNLTVNTTGSAGTVNTSLTVNGTATFTQGTLGLGTNSLTLNGPVAGTSGTVSTSGGSTLTVGNTGAMTYFPATSGSFGQLVLSRPGTLTLSSAFTANKMNISLGSTLNLGSNNLTLTATDATSGIVNNGTLNGTLGTTTFGGTFAQSLSGTGTYNFGAIQNNNATAGGMTVSSGSVNVFGTMTFAASAKWNASGGSTTLKSTATQRGSIAALPNGAQVNGNVTVESRLATSSQGWYFAGGTTKGLTVSNLNTQLMVRGIPGAPAPTGTGSPNVYFYNEATATNSGWTAATSLTNNLSRAFRAYLDVNFINLNNQVMKFTGQLNVGNGADQSMVSGETFSWPVTFTPSGWSGGGWNLLHNPYPSNLLLDNSANWTSANMSPTFHFWNAAAGTYMTWNRSTGSGTKGDGLIAIGQAFFGQATASGPSITVAEGAKTSSSTALMRQGVNAPTLTIRFGQANNTRYDLAQLVLDNTARFSFDADLDANNLNGGFFDVTTNTTAGQELTVNSVPTPGQLYTIPMTYASYLGAGQQVSFDFTGVSNMSNVKLYLLDRELGTSTEITEGMTYTFTDNAPAHTRVTSRFAISLVPGAVTSLDPGFSGVNVSLYPNPASRSGEFVIVMAGTQSAQAQVEVVDATGKLVTSQAANFNDGKASLKLDGSIAAGVYQVKVKLGETVAVQRLVVR